LIVIKAPAPAAANVCLRRLRMEQHWFVWFVIGAMSTFGVVLAVASLLTRGK